MANDAMKIEVIGDFRKIEKELNQFKNKLKSTKFELGRSSSIARLDNSFKNLDKSISKSNKNLSKLSSGVETLKNVSRNVVKTTSYIKEIGTSSQKATTQIKQGTNEAKKSVDALGDSGLSAISKFAKWYLIGGAITSLTGGIKGLFETVSELDNSVTLMNFTFDATEKQFDNMIDASSRFAKQLGSNTQEVLEAVKIYTNLNDTQEEILKKSTASVVLSNLGGSAIGIEKAADSIQALQSQFGLLDDQAMEVVDTLTFVSANLSMDFTKGINEISKGVKASGALVSEAGFTYEQFISLMGKLVEKTRLSGSTISAGMKTIFSRIQRVSDISKEEISKIEGAYRSIGIEVRKSETEFQDMSITISQLSDKWGDLNSVQKSYIAELSAGVRQKSVFINLMDTYKDSVTLASDALDNQGFAMERNQIYVDSLGGKINAFKEQYQEMARSLIDKDFMKGFVDNITSFLKLLTDINDSFGLLNLTLLVTVGYLAIFKGSIIAIQATKFIGWIANAILMIEKLGIGMTTAAAFGGVLQAQLASLTLGLSAVIGAFVAWRVHQKRILEDLSNLSGEMSEFSNSDKIIKNMIDRMEKLASQMAMTKEEANEYTSLQEKMNKLLPEATNAIDNQNDSLSDQVDIYKQLNEEKRQKAISDAQDILSETQSTYEEDKKNVEKYRKELEAVTKTIELLTKRRLKEGELTKPMSLVFKDQIALRKQMKEELEKSTLRVNQHENALKILNKIIADVDPIFDRINAYKEEINANNDSVDTDNDATKERIQNQINLTKVTMAEVAKRIAEYRKEATAIMFSTDPSDIMKSAPFNTAMANILEGQKSDLETKLAELNKQFNKLSNISEMEIKNDEKTNKKTSKKTKEVKKYLAELQRLAEIQHELNMLSSKESLEDDDINKIKFLQSQIEKTRELQQAQHTLNEARRADLANLKEGTEEYNNLKNEIDSTLEAQLKSQNAIKGFTSEVDDIINNLGEDIEKTDKDIEKLFEKHRIEKFKQSISEITDAFHPFSESVEQLNKQISTLSSAGDKIGVLSLSIKRLSDNSGKISDLQSDFERLSELYSKAQTSAEKSSLAKEMESVSNNLRDAQLNAISFATEIGKVKIEALEEGHENVTKQLEAQIALIDSQLNPMIEGFLEGFADMPIANDLIGEAPDFSEYENNINDIFQSEKDRIAQINEIRTEANEDEVKETNEAYKKELDELAKHRADLQLKLERAMGVEENVAQNHYNTMLSIIQSFAGNSVQAIANLTAYANDLVKMSSRLSSKGGKSTYTTSGTYNALKDIDFSKNNVGFDGTNFVITPNYKNGGVAGGMSIVGDGHGSNGEELLVYPNGKMEMSDNKAQLKMLPKGTQVIPSDLTDELMSNKNFASNIMPNYESGKFKIKDWVDDKGEVDFDKVLDLLEGRSNKTQIRIMRDTFGYSGEGRRFEIDDYKETEPGDVYERRWNLEQYLKGVASGRERESSGFDMKKLFSSAKKDSDSIRNKILRESGKKLSGVSSEKRDEMLEKMNTDEVSRLLQETFGFSGKSRDYESGDDLIRNVRRDLDDFTKSSYSKRVETLAKSRKELEGSNNGSIIGGGQSLEDKLDLPTKPKLMLDNNKLLEDKRNLEEKIKDIRKENIPVEEQAQKIEDAGYQSALSGNEMIIDARKNLIGEQDKYLDQLREEYEANKDNPELAIILLEKYNQAVQDRNTYVNDLRESTKQYYNTIIENEQRVIDDNQEIIDDIKAQIDLNEARGESTEELYDNLKNANKEYLSGLVEAKDSLVEQRDALEVGSLEWNLLNAQIEKYDDSIVDSQTNIAKLNKQLEDIKRKETFDKLDKQLAIFKEMKNEEISRLEAQRDRKQEADKELEMTENIRKAQEKLNDTMKQRNVRLFTGKGFELVADPKAVQGARQDLTTAQKTMEEYNYNKAIDSQIASIRNQIQVYENKIAMMKKMYDEQRINNNELQESANIIIGQLEPANKNLIETYNSLGESLDSNIEKYNLLGDAMLYASTQQQQLNLVRQEATAIASQAKSLSSNTDNSRHVTVSNVNVRTNNGDKFVKELSRWGEVS